MSMTPIHPPNPAQRPEAFRQTVPPDWCDYNGHMNLAYYILAFDRASDRFLEGIGLDATYRETVGGSIFAAELHATYDAEVMVGESLTVKTRVLDVGARTVRLFHAMTLGEGAGRRVATNEVLLVHVDLSSRRSIPWPAPLRAALQAGVRDGEAREGEPWPAEAGRHIGQKRGERGQGRPAAPPKEGNEP